MPETFQRPAVIAVTGPMAAGKNYVCSRLEDEGWACVDADLLVHDAINLAAKEIFLAFEEPARNAGLKIANADGTVNRRELGRLLFTDPALLARQEAIVYPVITRQIEQFISEHEKTVINATVLYKTPQLLDRCEKILFVTAPFFTRLRRARRRDSLPYRQILRRFRSQKNLLKEYRKTGKEIQIIKNYS